MDVQVHDALPGIFPAVDADIITVGMVLLVQNLLGFIQQLAQGPAFFGCGGKEVRDMAFADDKHMPRGHRIFIIFDPGQVVFYKQVFPRAEDTIIHGNTLYDELHREHHTFSSLLFLGFSSISSCFHRI
ncbi:MAG TPA: hypothetical protein P5227_09855, partial [Emcibacteraceae bacterium]|nr:hypothetical protein [Emcibacteraceae bacterium]